MYTKGISMKELRRDIILSIVAILIAFGLNIITYINFETLSISVITMVSALAISFLFNGLVIIFRCLSLLKDPISYKDYKILKKDERLKLIAYKSGSYSFIVSLILQVIAFYFALIMLNVDIKTNTYILIIPVFFCLQIIIYLIVHFILSKRN